MSVSPDFQEVGCLSEVHPPFGLLPFGGMARDLVVRTQRGDPFLDPAVPAAGLQTASSEDTGNRRIGTNPLEVLK
jgi:hypothetical protein